MTALVLDQHCMDDHSSNITVACLYRQTECNTITSPTPCTVLTIAVLMSDGAWQVLKCRDHKTGELVALKVIRNQKRFHKQAQVEVKILEHLRAQVTDLTKSHIILNNDSRNCCLRHNSFACCCQSITSCAISAWYKAEAFTHCSASPTLSKSCGQTYCIGHCTASALHCFSFVLHCGRP